MNDEWCFRLSRYSKFLFRRWLTSMFTSVSFWKIAAMLVQSSTTFRGGGWGVSSLILCTHRHSVSQMALLWVFLFRPWLTIFLFWNIALTFKLREVPPRYSGLQSLSGTSHKEKSWLNQHKYWQSNLCEASCKIELQQAVSISDSMFMNITKMIGLRRLNLEKSKITDIGVQSMSGRRIVIHARWERMA